ncbi:MAG: SGNH/GDSL hydrolase family protein [Planctomycetales bacterium]
MSDTAHPASPPPSSESLPPRSAIAARGAASAAPPFRVLRLFGRLGLMVAPLVLLLAVLVIDVLLTGGQRPAAQSPTGTFDMTLVTYDGRMVGGREYLTDRIRLSPVNFYENQPGWRPASINSLGFRGPELDATKTRPRVVLLGGSAAYGLGVDEEETFLALLRRRFPEYEFINAGVNGYLSVHELGATVFRVLDLEPDLIIAFDGWNDIYDEYWRRMNGDGSPRHPFANSNSVVLENRLVRLWELENDPWTATGEAAGTIARGSTILSWLGDRLRPRRQPPAEPRPLGDRWYEEARDRYVANLSKLHTVARGADCRLLVAIQPEAYQLLSTATIERIRASHGEHWLPYDFYFTVFPELYAKFREEASARLRDAGIEVLDMSASFAKSRPTKDALEMFLHKPEPDFVVDNVHLTPRGHEEAARILVGHVAGLSREPAGR